MLFRYVAIAPGNTLVKGTIRGGNRRAAEESLNKAMHRPIRLEEISEVPKLEQFFPSLFKIKGQNVINFANQLAAMLETGVKIVPALELLERETQSKPFKRVISQISEDVLAGRTFADALDTHPQVFSEVFRSLVRVGERLGEMDVVLKQGAVYLERQATTGKKIKKAITYPAVLVGVSSLVMVLLITVVLPPMLEMLTDMEVDLPLPTRILQAIIGIVGRYPLYLFLGFGVLAGGGVAFQKHPRGKRKLQGFLLRAPFIGRAILGGEMARFCRTISILTRAGLSLPQTIPVARQTTGNAALQEAITEVEQGLCNGQGLGGPIARNPIFPSMLAQMVSVAEETGALESTLAGIADHYDLEADESTQAMISIIEPAVTVGIACLVAFIALSVIMPMYAMIGGME